MEPWFIAKVEGGIKLSTRVPFCSDLWSAPLNDMFQKGKRTGTCPRSFWWKLFIQTSAYPDFGVCTSVELVF